MSSSDGFEHIPQTRDASPNWVVDTDQVDPVTPELALVDPELARGEINDEVTMSSTQFSDGTLGGVEPLQPLATQPSVPLHPIQPLAPFAAPTVESTAAAAPSVAATPAPVPSPPSAGVPVSDMRDVPLGTLVFRAGLLPEERLEEALHEGMKTGKRLGEILLERGWVSEADLGRLLAGQKGLPFVELDLTAVDPTAPPLLQAEKARLHGALPIGFEGGVPVVAVADPSNDLVVENVRRALSCDPVLVVAGRDALNRTIEEVYGVEPQAAAPVAPSEPAAEMTAPDSPVPVETPFQPVAEPVQPVVPAAHVVATEPVVETALPVDAPPTVVPAAQPVVPAAPVAEPPVAEAVPVASAPVEPPPVAAAPSHLGEGVWLGEQPADPQLVVQAAVPQPPAPVQPAVEAVASVAPAEPVEAFRPAAPAPAEPAVAASPGAETPAVPVEPEPVAAAAVEPPTVAAEPQVELTWAVELRLVDGERLELGSFSGEAEALEGGRGVVGQIESGNGWPFVAGRFIRPDAIVSVDLVKLETSRWLGSAVRAAAMRADG